jgi:predicted metal-dependent HD superfamily phosphohydrolase
MDWIDEVRFMWQQCTRGFATFEAWTNAFTDVARRYAEPDRHYHTIVHVGEVVRDTVDMQKDWPWPAPGLAAILHDVIYDTKSNDNEARSAEYASEILKGLGAPSDVREEMARLILLTRTHDTTADDEHGCALLDADLKVLSAEPQVYDAYASAIRREYAWVPDAQYREGRRGVLERFLARPRIFYTARFGPREPLARANLAREIASLS